MGPADPNSVRRILLVGFMGCGKSTVGRALAGLLGWTFLDIDALVVEDVGLDVPEIFARHGEPYFRTREHEATLRALRLDHHVLASGGGWPAVPGRMTTLGEGTASVFLDVSAEELLRRLEADTARRPLLSDRRPADVLELLERRRPYYELAALTVDAGSEVSTVAHSIARSLFRPFELDTSRTFNPHVSP